MTIKKFMALCAFFTAVSAGAQTQARFGYANCDSLLRTMPEYAAIQQHLDDLRKKYDEEATYNERTFKRQFAEFLQGQKDFTQQIMLKRQRDLQASLESSLAFRHEADSLLRQAEAEMLRPLRLTLHHALRSVGMERNYEYITDTSKGAFPYVNPAFGEDATPFIVEKLQAAEAAVQ